MPLPSITILADGLRTPVSGITPDYNISISLECDKAFDVVRAYSGTYFFSKALIDEAELLVASDGNASLLSANGVFDLPHPRAELIWCFSASAEVKLRLTCEMFDFHYDPQGPDLAGGLIWIFNTGGDDACSYSTERIAASTEMDDTFFFSVFSASDPFSLNRGLGAIEPEKF